MNSFEVLDLIACPRCKSKFQKDGAKIQCVNCDYQTVDNANLLPMIDLNNYQDVEEKKFMQSIQNFWDSGWQKRLDGEDQHDHFHQSSLELKKFYDNEAKTQMRPKYREFLGLLANEVEYDKLEGKIGINVGCGSGDEVAKLSYWGKSHCIPVDLTSHAAQSAQRVLEKLDRPCKIAVQADARYLPFRDESLDFYYSSGVLHHSPNIEKSISEIKRVLRPGGVAYVGLYSNEGLHFINLLIKAVLHGNFTKKSIQHYVNENTEQDWITTDQKNPLTNLYSKRQCEELFKDFSSVQVRKDGIKWVEIPKIGRFLEKIRPSFIPPGIQIMGNNSIMAIK